jgi:glycosyltransferase involved in cell wall biosynthesis
MNLSTARVALAHHWLVGMRGGEKVLEQFSILFPDVPIYTLVAQPRKLSAQLQRHPIHTSALQHIPGASRHYKKLLPFFPLAIGSLRINGPVDLVLSSDASVIKGLKVPPKAIHVCYCHSPPRYLWDLQKDYMQSAEAGGAMGRTVFRSVTPYVREFDRKAAQHLTHFIANSAFVRDRIEKYYGRPAHVIHPPVSLEDFTVSGGPPDDFYLVISQLVPYKRIDLGVAACSRLGRNLVVIGEGSERARLESMAGPTVSFLGSQPLSVLQDHYRRCRALLFPGIEDFGITPLEAQASGRPVIAYGVGGVLETVREGVTGIFFNEQLEEALSAAILDFETRKGDFDPDACRRNAESFRAERFRREISEHLESLLAKAC